MEDSSNALHPLHSPGGGRPSYTRIEVGRERTGILRGNVLHLTLTLTVAPDAAWVRAFEDDSQFREQHRTRLEKPTIEHDKICISLHETELTQAWWYIDACVGHANAVARRLFIQQSEP